MTSRSLKIAYSITLFMIIAFSLTEIVKLHFGPSQLSKLYHVRLDFSYIDVNHSENLIDIGTTSTTSNIGSQLHGNTSSKSHDANPLKPIQNDDDEQATTMQQKLTNITTSPSSLDKRLCTREEIKIGSWVPITMMKPPYVSRTTHLRCYTEDKYEGEWNTYDWKPSADCELTKWEAKSFCSILRRATVLIIGDSLSWEHYSSLAQLLGLSLLQEAERKSKRDKQNYVRFACDNQVRLVFRRDDLLRNITTAIEETFPQVLVLNRGAHFANDTILRPEIEYNFREVKAWQDTCDRKNMTCHLFWRTTVPGHPFCDMKKFKFKEPVNDLKRMERYVANRDNYNERTIKYNWFNYQHQNLWVVDLMDQMLGERPYDVLDAYYLNILRPDEHRGHEGDCLHSCYPGKMDVYSRLLLHFLRLRRTKEDIDALDVPYLKFMAQLGNITN